MVFIEATGPENMPDLDDIHNALDRHDMPPLQATFASLIGVQGQETVTGAASLDDLMSIFSQVCLVLEEDKTEMPGAVSGELKAAGTAGGEPFAGSTFADGAAFALRQISYFRGRLQSGFGGA